MSRPNFCRYLRGFWSACGFAAAVFAFSNPVPCVAAITFDASSNGVSPLGASSLSWSHTVGSALSGTVLVVAIDYYGGLASQASSVSYGSQNLLKLTRSNDGSHAATTEMWYL